ncbi:17248_t:CDS:2 [Cetraspora pellucida]|uniref:17248_t:CDS:1 n=1 Tax=Cetraspora pellucida TaxID=1433469 RepID=A0A9N9CQN4_9GLOM|nr:17248_t:CDS:2 [Cetraspora pellucida]
MPSTITVICFITDRQENTTSKALTVVKATRVIHLKNNASLLNVLLVRFYPQNDDTQDPTLLPFSTEDVLLATGKFRFVKEVDNDEKKFPILKACLLLIILYNIVPLVIDPSDLPESPLLISITATVIEPPQNDPHNEDISLSIETKDFMDQGNITLKLELSTLFMNGDLMIVDDAYVVQLHNINFYVSNESPEINNSDESSTNKTPPIELGTEKVARMVASRVKDGRQKRSTETKPYLKLNERPKVTNLAKKMLNQNPDIDTSESSVSQNV